MSIYIFFQYTQKQFNEDTRTTSIKMILEYVPEAPWQAGSFAPLPSIFCKGDIIVYFVSQPFNKA